MNDTDTAGSSTTLYREELRGREPVADRNLPRWQPDRNHGIHTAATFMLGTQFHPEFLSRPNRPHPLFREFMNAAQDVVREGGQPPLPLSQA